MNKDHPAGKEGGTNGFARFDRLICFGIPLAAALLLLALGGILGKVDWNGLPRGDVAIDAGVASSLAAGQGYWTPWERGSSFRLQEKSETFGHPADQHPPLWPMAGAAIMRLLGMGPSEALNWASLLAHLAILYMMVLLGRRLNLGRLAFAPAIFYALSSVGCAYSFNGSLYTAQAALYLCAAWLMSRTATGLPRALLLGVVLGAAYLLNYQAVLLLPVFIAARSLLLRRMFWKTPRLLETAAVLAAAAATAAPWLIRNAVVFKDAFYSVNPFYLLSKAGAPLSHRIIEECLVLEQESLPAAGLVKGLLGCAWINIPFLLLLLLALYPGCAAAIAAAGRERKEDEAEERGSRLRMVITVLLFFHLATALAWPALKVRYLVPAGPLVLLLAWPAVRVGSPIRRGRLLVLTILIGLFSAAVRLKGSLHGADLAVAFLVCFLPAGLVLLLSGAQWFSPRLAGLPAVCLGMLLLSAAGTWPGGAYFNVPPCPDFFGEAKDRMEAARSGDLVRAAAALEERGIEKVIGDLRLFHADPGLGVVTPPVEIPGEGYGETLLQAGARRSIRHAVLDKAVLGRQGGLEKFDRIWEGKVWMILRLEEDPGWDR